MNGLCCPVCGRALEQEERRFICAAGHSFDRARQGYVNLLLSQRPSGRIHGDDREMVDARRAFLERGYYLPLREELVKKTAQYTPAKGLIADAGCGEGWYTEGVAAGMPEAYVMGFDISKAALKSASRRRGIGCLAVASCYALPLESGCLDALLNLFSPFAAAEYRRVLKPGGHLFRVVPGEEHLWELKEAVYETPLPNRLEPEEQEGWNLAERRVIRSSITLSERSEIAALFQMTPYYYRTAPRDREKLAALQSLTTRTEFILLIYEKGKDRS